MIKLVSETCVGRMRYEKIWGAETGGGKGSIALKALSDRLAPPPKFSPTVAQERMASTSVPPARQ